MGRLWFLIVLIIDVVAILDVWSRESSMEKKVLWVVVIILLPLFGAVAWYVISRKIVKL
jgi:hypothetical protein